MTPEQEAEIQRLTEEILKRDEQARKNAEEENK